MSTSVSESPEARQDRVIRLCGQARFCFHRNDWAGTMTAANEAIQLDPQCAIAYSLRGRALMAQQDLTGALVEYDRAVSLAPEDVEVWAVRALGRFAYPNFAESGIQADLEEALSRSPSSASAWAWRGRARFTLGTSDSGALSDLDEAIRLAGEGPDLAEYHAWRAEVHFHTKAVQQGIEDLNTAIRLNPDNPYFYLERARIRRYETEDLAGALADADQAVRLAPDMVDAYLKRADLREANNDIPGALADLAEATRLNPTDVDPYQERRRLKEKRGDLAGARAELDAAIRANPTSAAAYHYRADFREDQAEYPAALADWDRYFHLTFLAQREPSYFDYNARSRVRRQCEDLAGALADLDSAIGQHGEWALLFEERAAVKEELGDEVGAKEDRARARQAKERSQQQEDERQAEAIRLQPTATEPLIERASTLRYRYLITGSAAEEEQEQGSPTDLLRQAIALLDRAILLDPQCLRAYKERADNRESLKDETGALADLNEVVRLENPPRPRTYLERGRLQRSLGHFDSAIADFREGLRLDRGRTLPDLALELAGVLSDKGDEVGAVHVEADGIRARLEATWGGALRGLAREIHGDLVLVLADYDAAGHPDEPEAAYYRRGLMRHLDHNPDGALEDYEKAIRANRKFAPAYRGRGVVKRERGELEEACVDLDQALIFEPDYPLAFYHRGNARQARGDLTLALADYNRALDVEPGMLAARLARGSIAEHQGNLAGALADYEEVLVLDPEDEVAYCARGRVRRALGQLDQASADFQAALARDPGYLNAFLAQRGVRITLEGAPLARALPFLIGPALGGALVGLGLGWLALLVSSALHEMHREIPWLPAGGPLGWLFWLVTVTLAVPLAFRVFPFADAPAIARAVVSESAGRLAGFDLIAIFALSYGLALMVAVWIFPSWLVMILLLCPLLGFVSNLHASNSEVKIGDWWIGLNIFLLAWAILSGSFSIVHAGLLGAIAGGLGGWLVGAITGGVVGGAVPGRCASSLLGFYVGRQREDSSVGLPWANLRALFLALRLVLTARPRRYHEVTPAAVVWQASSLVIGGTGVLVGFLAGALALLPMPQEPTQWQIWTFAGGTGGLLLGWVYGRRIVLVPRPQTSGGPTHEWQHASMTGLFFAALMGALLGWTAWELQLTPGGLAWWTLAGTIAGGVGGLRLWWMLE